MKIEERNQRVWLEYLICTPDAGGALACTIGRGHVVAPKRAAEESWSFLGVEVDPCGFRPQPVRMVEIERDDRKWYALVAEGEWRVLVATPYGINDFVRRVDEANIQVEWYADGYR